MPAPDIIDNPTMDATWWMKAAQNAVRRYCGWHVAPPVSETIKVDAYGGHTLLLPSKHVTAIDAINVDGADVLAQCDWSQGGTILLRSGHWPDRPRAVEVTLTHGWDPEDVPEIQQLILNLARRARSQPGLGNIQSQSVNGASVTYMVAGGAPLGLQLLTIEKETLNPYRLNWGPR